MSPKEKALELLGKYIQFTPVEYEYEYAKKCALIAIKDIIFEVYHYGSNCSEERFRFWQEVKQEIEKL